MAGSWNFERRRIVCGKFVVGVSLLAKGKPDVATSLEAVRNRMRLPPEDALFAARRLSEEQLIGFDEGGAVRSSEKGIRHAEELVQRASAMTSSFDVVSRTLAGGGLALEMLKVAVMARGGALECDAPEGDATSSYRLALAGDELTLERKGADGSFERAP